MIDALMDEAHLTGADLSGSNLTSTKFIRSVLDYAILDGARFRKTDFRDAQMKGIELSNAKFVRVNFTGTDLSGCVLWNCKFVSSPLEEAILHKSQINEAAPTDKLIQEISDDVISEIPGVLAEGAEIAKMVMENTTEQHNYPELMKKISSAEGKRK